MLEEMAEEEKEGASGGSGGGEKKKETNFFSNPKTPRDGLSPSRKRAREEAAPSFSSKKLKQATTSSSSSSTSNKTSPPTAKARRSTGMTDCLKTAKGQALLHMGWSEARVKAYMNKDNNPNAYFYRFNKIGEEQGKGSFSKDEKKRFKALIAKGVDYRWGIFSMQFPGRVGYQCSNFYRQLVVSLFFFFFNRCINRIFFFKPSAR